MWNVIERKRCINVPDSKWIQVFQAGLLQVLWMYAAHWQWLWSSLVNQCQSFVTEAERPGYFSPIWTSKRHAFKNNWVWYLNSDFLSRKYFAHLCSPSLRLLNVLSLWQVMVLSAQEWNSPCLFCLLRIHWPHNTVSLFWRLPLMAFSVYHEKGLWK